MTRRRNGKPRPPKGQPSPSRLKQRLVVLSGAVAAVWVFYGNVLKVQDQVCTLPIGQPLVSDACGVLGIGGRPVRAERIVWEGRDRNSCEALRGHITRFPGGAYADTANALLAARTTRVTEHWTPVRKPLPLFVGRDRPTAGSVEEARAAALARGQAQALPLCRDFAVTGLFRFVGAGAEADAWTCTTAGDGHVCGFEGRAVCTVEQDEPQTEEHCGSAE